MLFCWQCKHKIVLDMVLTVCCYTPLHFFTLPQLLLTRVINKRLTEEEQGNMSQALMANTLGKPDAILMRTYIQHFALCFSGRCVACYAYTSSASCQQTLLVCTMLV